MMTVFLLPVIDTNGARVYRTWKAIDTRKIYKMLLLPRIKLDANPSLDIPENGAVDFKWDAHR